MSNLADLEINDWLPRPFCAFLKETLIPDLYESGRDATAEDFETAVAFIERALEGEDGDE